MGLDQKQKDKRDSLVDGYEGQVKDKQNLISRLTDSYNTEVLKVQNELDELLLKRDGLKGLK